MRKKHICSVCTTLFTVFQRNNPAQRLNTLFTPSLDNYPVGLRSLRTCSRGFCGGAIILAEVGLPALLKYRGRCGSIDDLCTRDSFPMGLDRPLQEKLSQLK